MTLLLRPLDPEAAPEGLTPVEGHRGIALHWQPDPSVPAVWTVQRIGFHAVATSGQNHPPTNDAELDRYVRAAYVIAATHHPIPSDATVYYEVRR